jgi:VanZ family protein
MNRPASLVAVAAFFVICWIIALANAGAETGVFALVKAVPFGDKLGHACLFGLLAFLANRALNGWFVWSRWLQVGSLLVLAFALIEELTQHFNPNRTLDVLDALFDVVGVAIATLLTLRGDGK